MSNQQIYLALYRGRRSGSGLKVWLARAADWLTRKITRGQYSHCEIAIRLPENAADTAPLYECRSASIRDSGVRMKVMSLPPDKWDVIPLPASQAMAERLQNLWDNTRTAPYDYAGAIGLAISCRHSRRRWFCSEWCAQAIGLPESWRFSPNSLPAVVYAFINRGCQL